MNLASLFSKIRHEIKIYSNMIYILRKIEQDGFFEKLSTDYDKIFENEMQYAINGILNHVTKTRVEDNAE